MAAVRKGAEFPSSRKPRMIRSVPEAQLNHSGQIFSLDKNLLAQKSARIASQLQKNPHADIWHLLGDSPADDESMELIARFCHGFDINLSTENVVRVACMAKFLGMTDSHCPNNLLSKAFTFIDHHIVNSWSNCIKALKTTEGVFLQADELGIIKYCNETLVQKALDDPRLLGDIINDDEDIKNNRRPRSTRRKLFDIDWKPEDLTTLSFRLYGPAIYAMIQRQVQQEYVAANLCQYAHTWIFTKEVTLMNAGHREIIEGLVWLILNLNQNLNQNQNQNQNQIGLLPCSFLCEMLRYAVALETKVECRNGLELRIGMQLDEASTKDLLIPCQGYASDDKYDTECLRRILKHFYTDYAGINVDAMSLVSELMDDFLSEIAADIDLKAATFVAVAEMSIAAAEGTRRGSDGIYRAVDVYLEKHGYLTEAEKEDLCRVLDCNKLSGVAVEHAVMNGRLPVRVVMQALFVSQLKLREAIDVNPKALALKMEEEEEEEEEEGAGEEEGMKTEMAKMGSKVSELERECFVMRREMEIKGTTTGNGKVSVWRKMKRKFGCMTTMHDCDCLSNINYTKKKNKYSRI